MKLKRSVNRKVKGVTYHKWRLNLPREIVEELGWKEDEELDPSVEGGKLVIRRAKSKGTSE